MDNPARPLVAVIGGAKISGKIEVLENLAETADTIIVGGGMANTFLAATECEVAKSLFEQELVGVAQKILTRAEVLIAKDVMATKNLGSSSVATVRNANSVPSDEFIVDIGPETARQFSAILQQAGTVIWNGPMGIFEMDQFGEGTRVIAEAIASSNAYTLAGGGDTIAALERNDLMDQMDYVSTAGGAFLEFIEGKKLPAIQALEDHLRTHP